jgi:ABC-type sulfate transport system permease component
MFLWLAAVAVFVLIWGALWRSQLRLAFGILIGLPIAWIISRLLIAPLFSINDMHDFPVWLPPLPLATIALSLFVFGAVVWFRGNEGLSSKKRDDDHEEHH